ncbi:Myb-like DNA-binding domain containing protein [Tritrichomonas foetus]|uniref:Myb-like DNA-binding domain containing protein n=1 Tax=Tritrichomonas foetus TaxID=1144522 RepID=A0A1J4JVB4_9EUKA|nr:Myb-like DNA-binding domain containing protein [Tritrichomonas foetus]|eukprot:OHT03065.1 Myb-like DNA-binding domain containing protein [Tritrichomonas foetus]
MLAVRPIDLSMPPTITPPITPAHLTLNLNNLNSIKLNTKLTFNDACYDKISSPLQQPKSPSSDNEALRTNMKRPFNIQEDRMLINFVRTHGPKNWNSIAAQLQCRTAKQCRERWHNHLDPTISKGPWTAIEDKILALKHRELGNRWADIAKFLPGRTDTLVKNRWNTSVKDRIDDILTMGPAETYSKRVVNTPNEPKIFICPENIVRDFTKIPPLLKK